MNIGCLKRFLINQNVATTILIFQASLKSVLSLKHFQGKNIFIYAENLSSVFYRHF